MSSLKLFLLQGVQMVSAINLAMSSPLNQTYGYSQMTISSQAGKPTAARNNNPPASADLHLAPFTNQTFLVEGNGNRCEYDFNRSQYCQNGCCGNKNSSRNDVCCKGILSGPSDSQRTSKLQDIIGISALILVVVVVIAYQCKLSRINVMCLIFYVVNQTKVVVEFQHLAWFMALLYRDHRSYPTDMYECDPVSSSMNDRIVKQRQTPLTYM